MSRIGSNTRGCPTKEKRKQIEFKTRMPFLNEFYKLIWQYGVLKLSDETGICDITIRHWLQGCSLPQLSKVHQILDHLGYELLIFEKDEPFEEVDR